jgi:hypothetical protein
VPLSIPSIATQAIPRSQGSWNISAGGGAARGSALALLTGTSVSSKANRIKTRRKVSDFMMAYSSYQMEER